MLAGRSIPAGEQQATDGVVQAGLRSDVLAPAGLLEGCTVLPQRCTGAPECGVHAAADELQVDVDPVLTGLQRVLRGPIAALGCQPQVAGIPSDLAPLQPQRRQPTAILQGVEQGLRGIEGLDRSLAIPLHPPDRTQVQRR